MHAWVCFRVPETRGMNTPPQHHIRHFRRAFGRKPGALPHQSEKLHGQSHRSRRRRGGWRNGAALEETGVRPAKRVRIITEVF